MIFFFFLSLSLHIPPCAILFFTPYNVFLIGLAATTRLMMNSHTLFLSRCLTFHIPPYTLNTSHNTHIPPLYPTSPSGLLVIFTLAHNRLWGFIYHGMSMALFWYYWCRFSPEPRWERVRERWMARAFHYFASRRLATGHPYCPGERGFFRLLFSHFVDLAYSPPLRYAVQKRREKYGKGKLPKDVFSCESVEKWKGLVG